MGELRPEPEAEHPRVRTLVRDLRVLLDVVQRGGISYSEMRVIDLEEQRDDLLRQVERWRTAFGELAALVNEPVDTDREQLIAAAMQRWCRSIL